MPLAADVWDVLQGVGAVAGLVALALGIILSLQALRVFERPVYSITCSYIPPHDVVGFPTMPHFIVSYRNLGNVPVTFSDFELLRPRLDAVDASGKFILHTGADLYIDKRLSSRLGGVQEYDVIDYRTNKVELPPRAAHSDFFDLGALLGWKDEADAGGRLRSLETRTVPPDFHPVLTFIDSYANTIHCDEDGAHEGPYAYPHADALRADLPDAKKPTTLTMRRRRIARLGWKSTMSREP